MELYEFEATGKQAIIDEIDGVYHIIINGNLLSRSHNKSNLTHLLEMSGFTKVRLKSS